MPARETHHAYSICRIKSRGNPLHTTKHWPAVTCRSCLARYPGDPAKLQRVRLHICTPCLDGDGTECHTPGCVFEGERPPEWPLSVGAIEWVYRELGR